MVGLVFGALAVGDEEGASVLPEEGPDLFAISAGKREGFEVFTGGKMERAFLVLRRQRGKPVSGQIKLNQVDEAADLRRQEFQVLLGEVQGVRAVTAGFSDKCGKLVLVQSKFLSSGRH